jgi:hypothetical protein
MTASIAIQRAILYAIFAFGCYVHYKDSNGDYQKYYINYSFIFVLGLLFLDCITLGIGVIIASDLVFGLW